MTKEQLENMTQIAMDMILHAGNARNYNMEAIDAAIDGDFDKCDELCIKANESINKAHLSQTKLIQKEAEGKKIESTLLFAHAQDTLMTVNSEILISLKLVKFIKSQYKGK